MKEKVWLVTGVSKGLGKELAKQIATTGDIVIGTVRTPEDKNIFEREIKGKAVILDLTETKNIATVVANVVEQYGGIDVLVNNAGFGAFGMLEEFEETEINHQLNINFTAAWHTCKAVLPFMRSKGSGTIVQVSSRLGIVAGVGNGIYAASKFALEGLTESLKQEVEPFGIKVLLAEPGMLRTDFFGASVAYAKKVIPAYTEKLGDIRMKTKSINGKQPGNPAKAAQAIINAVNNKAPFFRLPLTAGTIDAMKLKIAELQNCVAELEALAVSIDD